MNEFESKRNPYKCHKGLLLGERHKTADELDCFNCDNRVCESNEEVKNVRSSKEI